MNMFRLQNLALGRTRYAMLCSVVGALVWGSNQGVHGPRIYYPAPFLQDMLINLFVKVSPTDMSMPCSLDKGVMPNCGLTQQASNECQTIEWHISEQDKRTCSSMSGRAAFVAWKAELRQMSMIPSHLSSGNSCTGETNCMPTLLHRMLTGRPNSAFTPLIICLQGMGLRYRNFKWEHY